MKGKRIYASVKFCRTCGKVEIAGKRFAMDGLMKESCKAFFKEVHFTHSEFIIERKKMSSLFTDKSIKPNDEMLAEVLGRSYNSWKEIRKNLYARYGPLTEEWKYYGAKLGWGLKLLMKKRNLFFFAPYEKYFRIAFIFGDKAAAVVEQSNVSPEIIMELKNAKRYAEGRGVRIDVRKKADIKNILTLVEIKVNN
jgi:hypothetical protein